MMIRIFTAATALLAVALVQAQFPGPDVMDGDEVCVNGYIMDRYCLDRGELVDNPGVEPLMDPAIHSFACMLDLEACNSSGYNILMSNGDGTWANGWNFTDPAMVFETGRMLGSCPVTCMNGTLDRGFHVTAKGMVETVDPPMLMVTELEFVEEGEDGCGEMMDPMDSMDTAPTPSTDETDGATQISLFLLSALASFGTLSLLF